MSSDSHDIGCSWDGSYSPLSLVFLFARHFVIFVVYFALLWKCSLSARSVGHSLWDWNEHTLCCFIFCLYDQRWDGSFRIEHFNRMSHHYLSAIRVGESIPDYLNLASNRKSPENFLVWYVLGWHWCLSIVDSKESSLLRRCCELTRKSYWHSFIVLFIVHPSYFEAPPWPSLHHIMSSFSSHSLVYLRYHIFGSWRLYCIIHLHRYKLQLPHHHSLYDWHIYWVCSCSFEQFTTTSSFGSAHQLSCSMLSCLMNCWFNCWSLLCSWGRMLSRCSCLSSWTTWSCAIGAQRHGRGGEVYHHHWVEYVCYAVERSMDSRSPSLFSSVTCGAFTAWCSFTASMGCLIWIWCTSKATSLPSKLPAVYSCSYSPCFLH